MNLILESLIQTISNKILIGEVIGYTVIYVMYYELVKDHFKPVITISSMYISYFVLNTILLLIMRLL